MRRVATLLLALASLITVPATAQLALPPVGGGVGDVLSRTSQALDPLQDRIADAARQAARLLEERTIRLSDLIHRNRDTIELDAAGAPARRGELLLVGPSDAEVAAAKAAGFSQIERERLADLEIEVVRLAVPANLSLAKAEMRLHQQIPGATIAADNLHFQSGAGLSLSTVSAANVSTSAQIDTPVGVIDGAPGSFVAAKAIRGFARGAPLPSNHGSAVASLLDQAGARKLLIADVYGADPAGGNALAICRGLNWLVSQGVRVVSISLVGPRNPLLAQAVAGAQQRGVQLVAPVGNDGPAAPPSFPASYPGVIAVTGVDGRNRALIEAGRALHLDYAAPAADMLAANAAGRWIRVRGTSYAAPLAAARVAAAVASGGPIVPTLDREALVLGRKRPDPAYGRGLLCASCRRTH